MNGIFTSMRSFLSHPLALGVAVDSPEFRDVSRLIIQSKPFLRKIYEEWYGMLEKAVPEGEGEVLEIGSGSGFCAKMIPGVVTSDMVSMAGVDVVFDACSRFPFADAALKSILMINTFHHLPAPETFLDESLRCLRRRGVVVMIEPWVTPWSRLVYSWLHHEPFDPDAARWGFAPTGPLSSANGAMPWIIFKRDRALLEERFPGFKITEIRPFMPFRYLVSGGISMRCLAPEWSFGLLKAWEYFCPGLAVFAMIALEKKR